jgi:hypothetical protein
VLSERLVLKTKHSICGGQMRDRTPSNACARKIPAPIKPINAVIASIIGTVLYAPGAENACSPAQSKAFPARRSESNPSEAFAQQVCQVERSTRLAPALQRLIHHASSSPFPPCSGCDILVQVAGVTRTGARSEQWLV